MLLKYLIRLDLDYCHYGVVIFTFHICGILSQVTEDFEEAKISSRGFGILDVGFRSKVFSLYCPHSISNTCFTDKHENSLYLEIMFWLLSSCQEQVPCFVMCSHRARWIMKYLPIGWFEVV